MEHLASGLMLPLQHTIHYLESTLLKEKDPNYPVFSVKVPSDQNFVNEDPADIFFIAFEDVFNLFHSKRLDYNLVRLYAINLQMKINRERPPHIAVADPYYMRDSQLQDGSSTRTKAVRYLESFMLMNKEKNTILLPVFPEDKYCTLIILCPKWSLAQYFDSSNTTTKKDYRRIRGVLDEAILGYSKNGGTFDKKGEFVRPDTKKLGFKHVIDFPCIKQPAGSIKEAFYVLHHLKGFVEDAEMMSLPPSKRDPIKMSGEINDDDLREDFHRLQMTYYVVFEGRVPGVYEEWEDCKKQVHKFSGNCYKGYPTRHEAVAKWRAHQSNKSKMKTFLVLSLLLTIVAAAMDRSWITDGTKKFTTKYMAGVRDFIKFAQEHLDNTDEPILCPCKDCLNLIRQDIKTVEDHCNCSGMSMTYTRWTRHGEGFSDDEGRDRDDDGAYDSDNDEEEDNGDCYVDDSSSMIDELQKSGNKGPDLPNIRITNRGFDLLLQLLRTALPDVDFPKSYADAKSVLSDVGLGYETIHACKFDCSLFWGDHKDDTHCHVCGVSRYRDPTGKKKIPHKVLRYFPIIKRLQRLFVKKEMSTHTRWHKEKRVVEPNVLRHPADGEAWKHFDGKFDWFAKDPRNIRLGFATDGFSPFGSMSNPYSMWPVFVIPYNFPPWMCMDQSNYMMALLIPGKYSPGKDFHVFMQPLIKDMMQLWSGVQTFDACTDEYFPLHAAFLWSIHDYPGYATMSGRSTRGFHACVHCDENPCAESLKNKIGYIGHRRFLDKSHPYRRSRLFNGKAETRDPPRKYTPKEVAAKVERVKDFEHGKNPISRKRKRATVPGEPTWHLKVSLHHLPYWPELKIAHNLDVMHIEKNICDNIVGTLLELEGRNKDTVSARIDLKKFKIWEKYWLKKIVKDDDDAAVTYAKPPAPWTLSKEQKRHLCRYLANTRFPDGYCANWGRCVNIDGCKVTGMKTHDCHILLQRVLPAGLKGIASKEMYVAIAELGRFFRELCAKTLKVDVLNRLKVEIVVILCKLEKLFPPAFFDVMVHLAIHLPEEALLRGPVHYGWMYPVERRLGYLKSTVRNKARPEGSIAEGYIVDECLIFCSRFFKDGTETRFNKDDRNQDVRRKPDRDEMEVFSVGAKGLGKSILKHFDKEFDKMVWYVLNNCDDVERYINEFRQELGGRGVRDIEETVQREFAGWFANHVRQLDNASEDLKSLAAGPDRRVVVYAGCNVKGARFRTLTRDKDLKTQNSGVATKGSFGDADETEYYGVLQEVLELQYGSNKHGDRSVYLFRCDWFDLDPLYPEGHPKRVEQDSQPIKTSAPSKKKKKKHKNVVESSEPINDPNSISISDAETESGNEHEEDNDKNDTPDKEEVEKEPEKHAKNKKYTKEDFITEKHGAVIDCNKGMVTFNVDDKEHTVYFPKRIDKKGKMKKFKFGELFKKATTSTGRPSRASTQIRRSYNEDVIAPSFAPEEDQGAPNASSFPCYEFLTNAGLMDDFFTLVNRAGLATYVGDERGQYYRLTKIFVESFKFHNTEYEPTVAFKIYDIPVTMKLEEFCFALGIAPVGTARRIDDNPRDLLELYRGITGDDCRTIQRGKIRNIQLPAIKYFAYYIGTSILGRENTSNISSYHLAFLNVALTGETPYHLGSLIARRLSSRGPIFGGTIASRILTHLDIPLDSNDVPLTPRKLDIAAMKSHHFVTTNSTIDNIVYKMLFADGNEKEIPLPQQGLFNIDRQSWSLTKEVVEEHMKIQEFHQQHDSENVEPSYDYTVTYPDVSSSTYMEPGRSSSYYEDTTSWGPWE
ncbi:hypothetical protein QYE76_028526 [Lolium multiflorum]|uniref:Uncharacterized protein n=1 Tax=Lolium multiflorum TaxID=4521 RepID=A0AAD8QL60_LOLMU|nr:hypothetical protein QYE76_028526 [Lolium multiflorum]